MHRFRIMIVTFVLAMFIFSLGCWGVEKDMKIRIRAPRQSNTEVSLGGYGSIYIYDNGDGDMEEIMELGSSVTVSIASDSQMINVYDGNSLSYSYASDGDILLGSYNSSEGSNMIKIDGKPYRGTVGFVISSGKLLSINNVGLDKYLYGVVPNEMPSSWNMEAVKAQAVAARTYALYYSLSEGDYDLEDSGSSQIYGGYESETPNGNKAVDLTRGEVIYYDGKPINAVFHSTSGGHTEDSENIWNDAVPYLRGVPDEYSNISPSTQWQKTVTKEYIVKRLNDDGKSVKNIYGMEITKVSANNRVVELTIKTDKGEYVYKKDGIRSLLGYDVLMSTWFDLNGGSGSANVYYTNEGYAGNVSKDNGSAILGIITEGGEENEGASLDSGSLNGKYVISSSQEAKLDAGSAAYISATGITKAVKDLSSNSSEFIFTGRGWGHGIGLSQYGAKKMAEDGYDYEEILKHYYTGVEIK